MALLLDNLRGEEDVRLTWTYVLAATLPVDLYNDYIFLPTFIVQDEAEVRKSSFKGLYEGNS